MTRVLLTLAAAAVAIFILIGVMASALTDATGSPAFVQEYHGMVHGALMAGLVILAALLAFAAILAGAVWLLGSRSPIAPVRAFWTRHLTPERAVSRTPRAAAHGAPSTQEGTS